MNPLIYIFLASIVISLGALIGALTLAVNQHKLAKLLLHLVALSAGALMGGAFLHLLPDAIQTLPADTVFSLVLIAFVSFFLIEKVFHWRHCHQGHCETHSFGFMNLVGDALHNFIDGLIIAATFMTSTHLGIVTTLAVALHEIPQEIGDFGVLLYSGYSRKKALISNLLVSLTSVIGGILGYYLSTSIYHLSSYLLPIAAGGFIYISASDLMPEIRKETNLKKSISSFITFILGILLIYFFKLLSPE